MRETRTPTVSVIVPNYNHARFLRQRLDTILAQTFQDFELILLDDCSTDESREILREYASHPRVSQLVFNETNSGSTFKQWNKGVRLARGKYVWIAESDDYADPRFLETLVSRLDADPSAVFAQCRTWQVSADGELMGFQGANLPQFRTGKWSRDFRGSGIEECRKYLCCSPVQNASSIIFRRDIYWEIGGADESLRQCGDWKVWASMALTGGTFSYVAEPLNYRRCHGANVTERNFANRQNGVWASETLHVISWILKRIAPEPEVLAMVRNDLPNLWVSAVLNRRIPGKLRRAILRDVMSIDPHAFCKLAPFIAAKVYYYLLELTYAPRHAIGVHRRRSADPSVKGAD